MGTLKNSSKPPNKFIISLHIRRFKVTPVCLRGEEEDEDMTGGGYQLLGGGGGQSCTRGIMESFSSRGRGLGVVPAVYNLSSWRKSSLAMRNLVYYTVMGPCKWVTLSLHLLRGRSYNLYENEDGSDVILMVGDEGYRERVPAHSWVLAASNHFFRAMFTGPMADPHRKTYNFTEDPKGFQNLLKWLYRRECYFQSLDSALITLQVAIQYLCPELAQHCVSYITQHLNQGNVLKVLQYVGRYAAVSDSSPPPPPSTAPSAPSLEELECSPQISRESSPALNQRSPEHVSHHTVHGLSNLQDLELDIDPTAGCTDLINSCLELIDKKTDAILASEHFEELDADTVNMIISRSSLNISSEMRIFDALQAWSTAACKRQQLPLRSDSRRAVLGNLLYIVRYLCLTQDQLFQGPQSSGLLSQDEVNYLRARLSGLNPTSVPQKMVSYCELMAIPRQANSKTNTPQVGKIKKIKKKYG
ncbi:unnamed protein product, partial [Meganyctiphanes norvegica]